MKIQGPTTRPVAREPVADGLLSARSLAAYLDCGATSAADLVASGTIPSLRVGSLRRVRKADADA